MDTRNLEYFQMPQDLKSNPGEARGNKKLEYSFHCTTIYYYPISICTVRAPSFYLLSSSS